MVVGVLHLLAHVGLASELGKLWWAIASAGEHESQGWV